MVFPSWKEQVTYALLLVRDVRREDNIIGSYVAYCHKMDIFAKARIVPCGHLDQEKDFLRGEAPSVSFIFFRLQLSFAAEGTWNIG